MTFTFRNESQDLFWKFASTVDIGTNETKDVCMRLCMHVCLYLCMYRLKTFGLYMYACIGYVYMYGLLICVCMGYVCLYVNSHTYV